MHCRNWSHVRDTMPDDAALSIETGREVIVLEDMPVPFFC
jgi:hypothetical protein